MNDVGSVLSIGHRTLDQWISHMLSHMISHAISHMGTPHAEQQAQAAYIVQTNFIAKSVMHHMCLHTVLFHLVEHRFYVAPHFDRKKGKKRLRLSAIIMGASTGGSPEP